MHAIQIRFYVAPFGGPINKERQHILDQYMVVRLTADFSVLKGVRPV